MRAIVRRSALGLLLLLVSASVCAAPITFQYSGNVNYAQFNPAFGGVAPAQVGDRLVLTYTFQSDAPPTEIFAWRTLYSGQGPLLAEILRGGSLIASWTIPSIDLMIVDNLNTSFMGYPGSDDQYGVRGNLPDAAGGTMPFVISSGVLLLKHESDFRNPPTAIQGTALPLLPPDPSVFDSVYLDLSRSAAVPVGGGVYRLYQHWFYQARIDSFGTAPSIPEPSTLLLLGASLAALALSARPRRAPR